MAKIALAAVGAAAGFLIAGPFGMQLGAMAVVEAIGVGLSVGSTIGGIAFRPSQRSPDMPPMSSLQISSSANGAPIPFGYGTNRYAGQLIWSPGITTVPKNVSTGGSGGGGNITNYTYFANFAVAFGEGPGVINRIWADSKLIFDANPGALSDLANEGVLPWNSAATYQAGNLVALGGQAWSAQITNTDSYPTAAQTSGFTPWVAGSYIVGTIVTYSGATYVCNTDTIASGHAPWSAVTAYNAGDIVDSSGIAYLSIGANTNQTPVSSPGFWTPTESVTPSTASIFWRTIYPDWSSSAGYTSNQLVTRSGALYICLQANTNQDPASGAPFWALYDRTIWSLSPVSPTTGAGYANWSPSALYNPGALVLYSGTLYECIATNTNHPPPANPSDWALASVYPAWQSTITYHEGDIVSYLGQTYICITSPPGSSPPAGNGNWELLSQYFLPPTMYPGDEQQLQDPLIVAAEGGQVTPAFRGLIYCVFDQFPLLNFGNRIPNIRAEIIRTKVNNTLGPPETGLTNRGPILAQPILNGWGPNAHVGSYEHGVDQGFFFGVDPGSTGPYTNPGAASDGSQGTFAYAAPQHTHQYYGCVWGFTDAGSYTGASLNILSEVPASGTDGFISTLRSAGVWYTLDGGSTWTQIYDQAAPRTQQFDSIPLTDGADLTQIQVMAFTDGHDDMYHKVYEISVTGTPA